jgi:hypothetical protein
MQNSPDYFYCLKISCINLEKIIYFLQEYNSKNKGVGNMAKNKPVFQSNNSKGAAGQQQKGNNKTAAPAPKKTIRGNSRGQ